ncbi:MAG: four helix bundle protein [Leptospiraceae bacterium]|nr:four helix bundle protein [Leptospiraceae bacterium]
MSGSKNILRDKSYQFALQIVQLSRKLDEQRDYVLSKQILRSGTAIGALVRESEYAQSKADFAHKLSIALKEANETEYWLQLLFDSQLIDQSVFNELRALCIEIIKIATASIKTAKGIK